MLHVPVNASVFPEWVRKAATAINQLITGKQDANANLTSIAGLSLTGNSGDAIVVKATEDGFELAAGGGGGTTDELLTFNNGGAGAASGATFDGSAPVTVSYNTVGAAASGHNHDASYSAIGHDHDSDYLQLTGGTLTGDLVVPAEAYGAGWNGSNEAATKNDIYDKIESMGGSTLDFQAADLVITTNNVFQDTDLSIALTAGSYAIEAFYTTDVNATPDMEAQFTYTGTVTDVAMIRYAARGGTTSAVEYETLPAVYNMDATDHYSVHMHGQIIVSDSGNFKLQVRQVTSSATSVTFKKASWMRLTRLA